MELEIFLLSSYMATGASESNVAEIILGTIIYQYEGSSQRQDFSLVRYILLPLLPP